MAIAVGSIYKGFTFDGIDSKTYGVYISGDAVFNAPERDVEMIDIPGRNGSFALDKGRFQNITVTYPAGLFDGTESDFADSISEFRNLLASKKGYCRLEDDYNTGEYRMAVYRSGLEVDPAQLKAGEFEIVFDCMPQRYLTSGETAVAVLSGGTMTNPTLFDSAPLFTVKGYGTINIGGSEVTVEAVPTGDILLGNKTSISVQWMTGLHSLVKVSEIIFDANLLNTGDDIFLDATGWSYDFALVNPLGDTITSVTISNQTGTGSTSGTKTSDITATIATTIAAQAFKKGTSKTVSHSYMYDIAYGGGSSVGATNTVEIRYDGSGTFELWVSRERTDNTTKYIGNGSFGALNGDSTVLVSGDIYIDTDLGEAYWNNGEIVSANFAVNLGGDLPRLAPGANTITYSNTFTSFKVTPRWWRV